LSVYWWIRAFKTGRKCIVDDPRSGRLSLDHIDTQILSSLKDNPWYSVRTLAQELCTPASTLQRHLRESLCFSPCHCVTVVECHIF
jgi:AraC-like DNA-binding protein